MDWKTYARAFLLFNLLGLLVAYALQRLQGVLPLNPQGVGTVSPDLAFNTAASFATNTNWQSYSGEVTLGYLTQMLGLTVQNFVSAAAGMAVLIALARGIAGHSTRGIGNFWADVVRGTLYILMPMALVLAVLLVSRHAPRCAPPSVGSHGTDEPSKGDDEMATPDMPATGRGEGPHTATVGDAPTMGSLLRAAAVSILALSLIVGLAYPLVVTAVARVAFPDQATGSLAKEDGRIVGSALIGQPFDDPAYFWSRPSATSPYPYNAAAGTGTNYGPLNPNLLQDVGPA